MSDLYVEDQLQRVAIAIEALNATLEQLIKMLGKPMYVLPGWGDK